MMETNKEEIDALLGKIIEERKENAGKVIEEKKTKLGEEAFYETARRIALYATDVLWMEHLEAMDYLRSSVNLRAYGQREPIVEYKKEGLMMFRVMEEAFKEQVFSLISSINTENVRLEKENKEVKEDLVVSHTEPSELGGPKDKEVGLSTEA